MEINITLLNIIATIVIVIASFTLWVINQPDNSDENEDNRGNLK